MTTRRSQWHWGGEKGRNKALKEGVETRKVKQKGPKKTGKIGVRNSKNVASKIKVVDDGAGKKIKKEEVEKIENQTKIQDYWEPQGMKDTNVGREEEPILVDNEMGERAVEGKGKQENNNPRERDTEAGGLVGKNENTEACRERDEEGEMGRQEG